MSGGASIKLMWSGRSGVDFGLVWSTSEFFTGLSPSNNV